MMLCIKPVPCFFKQKISLWKKKIISFKTFFFLCSTPNCVLHLQQAPVSSIHICISQHCYLSLVTIYLRLIKDNQVVMIVLKELHFHGLLLCFYSDPCNAWNSSVIPAWSHFKKRNLFLLCLCWNYIFFAKPPPLNDVQEQLSSWNIFCYWLRSVCLHQLILGWKVTFPSVSCWQDSF